MRHSGCFPRQGRTYICQNNQYSSCFKPFLLKKWHILLENSSYESHPCVACLRVQYVFAYFWFGKQERVYCPSWLPTVTITPSATRGINEMCFQHFQTGLPTKQSGQPGPLNASGFQRTQGCLWWFWKKNLIIIILCLGLVRVYAL